MEPDCTGRWKCLQTLRQIADCLNQPAPRVPWMRTGEADALDAFDIVHISQEIGELARRVVRRRIVIHDLAEKLNLLAAGLNGVANVGQDVRLVAHPLVAAGVRHHAERAVVVAPLDDRHVGLHGISPVRDAQRKRHIVHRRDVDRRR